MNAWSNDDLARLLRPQQPMVTEPPKPRRESLDELRELLANREPEAKPETMLKAGDTPDPALKAGDTPDPVLKAGDTPNPALKAGDTPNPALKAGDTPNPALKARGAPDPGRTPALRSVPTGPAAANSDRTPGALSQQEIDALMRALNRGTEMRLRRQATPEELQRLLSAINAARRLELLAVEAMFGGASIYWSGKDWVFERAPREQRAA